jgi:FG-GAP-like repeat/Secretion system C-terminal sorting domain
MKSHFVPFSRKWRQFRFLSRKLNRLLETGKFQLLSHAKQRKLLNRLKELFSSLNGVISTFRLKKALSGAIFLLGLAFSNSAFAQTFAPAVSNPFGISMDNFSAPVMVDIDDDGDLDMFISEYNEVTGFQIKFVENIGSADSPDFTGQQAIDMPFGIQLQNLDTDYITLFDFADMDNDGDQDLLVGGTNFLDEGSILYFENSGTATQANFGAPALNPFGFQPTYYNAFPDLVDIDNDGDFDLLVSEYYANIQFFENVGTPEAPMFASPVQNPFGITQPDTAYYSFVGMADIDGDGDQDLLRTVIEEYGSNLYYQENIGTPADPDFAAPVDNPFGFSGFGIVAIPHLADIDADGDIDVFFGNYGYSVPSYFSEILFFENTTAVSTNDLLKETTLKFGPNPASEFISLQSEIIINNAAINLSLVNIAGQVFEQQTIHSFGNQINWKTNIRHLPPGSYFLRLDTEGHFGVIPFNKI